MKSGLAIALALALALSACAGRRDIGRYEARTLIREDVPYQNDQHPKHATDWYTPDGAGPYPIALFIHGGVWSAQDRRYYQRLTGYFGAAGIALAREGWTAGVAGYRQHPEADAAGSLADLTQALAWASSAALGDTRCVIVLGHSAGALWAGHLAFAPERPANLRGVVLLAGLYEVEELLGELSARKAEATRRVFGETAEARLRWSLLPRANEAAGLPILLLAAEEDDPVLLRGHQRLLDALREAGADVEEAILPEQGHMDLSPALSHGAVMGALRPWLQRVRATCPG